MQICIFLTFVFLSSSYWLDKRLFLRVWAYPHKFDDKLCTTVSTTTHANMLTQLTRARTQVIEFIMPFSLANHLLMAQRFYAARRETLGLARAWDNGSQHSTSNPTKHSERQ